MSVTPWKPPWLPRALSLLWLATAAVAACPVVAHAQGQADRAEALFIEAKRLVESGNFTAACPKFEESQRLDPAVGTQYNLALCYAKTGRLGSAYNHLREVERLAHATGKTAREEAARSTLAELRPRVPHLVLAVRGSDVTLKVDGNVIDRADWSLCAVDPGEHTVEASAPAKKTWQQRVTVPETPSNGSGSELRLEVPELASAPGQVRVVTKETSSTRRTIGFALASVGLAGLATAAVTGVLLLQDKSTADEKCKPTCIDDDGRNAVSRGKTLLPINAVAWGVGVVALGVGTFLLITSKPKGPPAARLQVRLTGTGVAVENPF